MNTLHDIAIATAHAVLLAAAGGSLIGAARLAVATVRHRRRRRAFQRTARATALTTIQPADEDIDAEYRRLCEESSQ